MKNNIYDKINKHIDKVSKKYWDKYDDNCFKAYSSAPNKNIEGWEEELEKFMYDRCTGAEFQALKDLITQTLSAQREEIEKLLQEEMLICYKEGTATSRLTSLSLKIRKLNQ
jgi:hypothetical protein